MSLENNLVSIAKSLELIAAALTQKNANPTPVDAPAQPVPVPVAAVPAPVVAAPTPVLASPFSDKNAMMDFVMTSYRAMGAEKGAKIQDVLTAIGYKNINDVDPAHWGALKSGIEALK